MLVDEDSGRAIYLRTTTGYTYEVGDEAAERHFTLRISDGDAGASPSAPQRGSGGGRAQIVHTLSADATVDVEVPSPGSRCAGLVGARADGGPQQPPGTRSQQRRQRGPGRPHLVRITARSESGQQVSAVRSLQLGR